jgi:hypothetical protein
VVGWGVVCKGDFECGGDVWVMWVVGVCILCKVVWGR